MSRALLVAADNCAFAVNGSAGISFLRRAILLPHENTVAQYVRRSSTA